MSLDVKPPGLEKLWFEPWSVGIGLKSSKWTSFAEGASSKAILGSVCSMTGSFENLLSPGRIGALELPNRIIMTAMGSDLADGDGFAGERIAEYYAARARGGAG